MQNLFDEQLIFDYLKGNENSLEILIRRYLKPIYSFVYRYVGNTQEAQDITQETFLKVWKNLKKFDQQRSFKTWIFNIAKNTSIDFSRRKKTVVFSEFDTQDGQNILANTITDPSPLPSELMEQKDIQKTLASALQKLAPAYRMVLYLRYNDHFTFKEIAQTLGEPLDTVKSRHRRGIIMLHRLLA